MHFVSCQAQLSPHVLLLFTFCWKSKMHGSILDWTTPKCMFTVSIGAVRCTNCIVNCFPSETESLIYLYLFYFLEPLEKWIISESLKVIWRISRLAWNLISVIESGSFISPLIIISRFVTARSWLLWKCRICCHWLIPFASLLFFVTV